MRRRRTEPDYGRRNHAESRGRDGAPETRAVGDEQPLDVVDHQPRGLVHRESRADVVVDCFHSEFLARFGQRLLHRLPHFDRRRGVGAESSGRLGLGYHELCLLDRYRPRRHPDFRHLVPHPPEVAYFDQPGGRGHDPLCRGLRRHFPGGARRPHLDGLVPCSGAEFERHLAEFPQSVALGRLRGLDLFHGFRAFLVYRLGA